MGISVLEVKTRIDSVVLSSTMYTRISPLLRLAPRMRHVRSYLPAEHRTQKQIAMDIKAHMDFFPVPEGDWNTVQNAINQKRNLLLAASFISMTVMFYVCYDQGRFYAGPTIPTWNEVPKSGKPQ